MNSPQMLTFVLLKVDIFRKSQNLIGFFTHKSRKWNVSWQSVLVQCVRLLKL